MIKQFTNKGNLDYCFAEVEQGKIYNININANDNIVYQYVITNDEHTNTQFCGPMMFKQECFANSIHHIIKAEKTGHLCIRDSSVPNKMWSTMTVEVEEINNA